MGVLSTTTTSTHIRSLGEFWKFIDKKKKKILLKESMKIKPSILSPFIYIFWFCEFTPPPPRLISFLLSFLVSYLEFCPLHTQRVFPYLKQNQNLGKSSIPFIFSRPLCCAYLYLGNFRKSSALVSSTFLTNHYRNWQVNKPSYIYDSIHYAIFRCVLNEHCDCV